VTRSVNSIVGRLSLRTPQRTSLERLDRVMEIAQPHRNRNAQETLAIIRNEFPSVQEFERAFPSLCFALATGVGKTRLMGAFIAYLHLEHGIRHFFVLAPNLTIYNKLVLDFTPNTPKYVFQGVAEFAVKSPALITGDNFEQRPQALDLFERDDVAVNIFNVGKFAATSPDSRKMRRLSEYLGQSYFDYLAGLSDLVLIMDEAHRYRAGAALKSIEDLKPVLGLELTATPQIQAGNQNRRFKNIIFDYPLAQAMRDGYVKEPAVATRANFKAEGMDKDQLQRLKLEDGVRVHESTKVDLEVYSQQNDVRKVKPFMLVIAENTEHAADLKKLIESEQFFEGRYKGRVIEVHSGQSGAEKDDNVEQLLSVERADNPVEIVVHVNMLKEGWDVTNLFTIVPLRAADSKTLVEQSIGRGLRLPYGKRTGVAAVDRLTIIAHDRFQEIVDAAKSNGYSFSTVEIGKDVAVEGKETVIVAPTLETVLGIAEAPAPVTTASGTSAAPTPKFTKPQEVAAAKLAVAAIQKVARDIKLVPGPQALQTPALQKRLVAEVTAQLNAGQLSIYPVLTEKELGHVVRETCAAYGAQTIFIPRVNILPKGDVQAGFHKFKLDAAALSGLLPVTEEILLQSLVTQERQIIGAVGTGIPEARLQDYVVRGLIDFDDVDYDDQSELLYDLGDQVVAHLLAIHGRDESKVRSVLLFHQRQVAQVVHTQMQKHALEAPPSAYEAVVSQGYAEVRPQSFARQSGEQIRPFDKPVANNADIPKMLFGGFKKCLYPEQKFDSDPERRFAELLEREVSVIKWFKPGKGVFKIRYTGDHDYEPDFVVETKTEKLLCEPKRADQLQDPVVQAKATAAREWCKHAGEYELKNGGKPWRYVLIPHKDIGDNMTLEGVLKL